MRRKKICIALLISAVLTLCFSGAAFAKFTGYTENFEDTVWNEESMLKESTVTSALIEAVDGYSGKALSLKAESDGALGSVKYTGMAFVEDLDILDTSKTYVYTQRIKFTGTPDSSFNMSFSDGLFHDGYPFYVGVKDGKYVFASSGSANGMASAKDVGEGWHTLVSKLFYNSDQAKYDFETSVYDEAGEMVWSRLIRGTSIASTANPRNITYMFNNLNTGGAVLIDEAKLYVLTENAQLSVDDGDTGIARNAQLEFVTLNGAEAEKISLLDESGNPVAACRVIEDTTLTFKIVPTELLGKNKQYTISFDEGLGVSDVTFTAGAQYILKAECSGAADSENAKQLSVSYKFTDKGGIEKISCRMMGILYEDGKMIDAALYEIAPDEVNVNTQNTVTLTFNKDIGENTQASIVFFEDEAYIPMSTGIELVLE